MQDDGQRCRFPFGGSSCLDSILGKVMWLNRRRWHWHFSIKALKRCFSKQSDATHAEPRTHLHETLHIRIGLELILHSSIRVEQSFTAKSRRRGWSKGRSARRGGRTPSVREEYSPSSSFQSQLVAKFPYPHILLCKMLGAHRTKAFEIRLGPACSRCVPEPGAGSCIIRAAGALYITSREEVRSDWWRIFGACDRSKKTAAFIRWLHGVQRLRIDERGDQCYRHPPCGVLERIVTNGEDNRLKRAKIHAELGLRPSAILVVRPWILEAD